MLHLHSTSPGDALHHPSGVTVLYRYLAVTCPLVIT